MQDDRVSEDLPFGSRGGLAVRYYFPVDGEYVVKIFFDAPTTGASAASRSRTSSRCGSNGAKIKQFTVGGAERADADRAVRATSHIDGTEVRFPATAGPGVLGLSFVKKTAEPEGMRRPLLRR